MKMHAASFLAYLRDRGFSENTVERYARVLDGFVAHLRQSPEAETTDPRRITKTVIVGFLRSSGASGAEPSGVVWNVRLACLRSFFVGLLLIVLMRMASSFLERRYPAFTDLSATEPMGRRPLGTGKGTADMSTIDTHFYTHDELVTIDLGATLKDNVALHLILDSGPVYFTPRIGVVSVPKSTCDTLRAHGHRFDIVKSE